MSAVHGVYIHIPFCKAKCKYCAFVSIADFSLRREYVNALVGEIRSAPEKGSFVDTVYIGGGTPSCLYDGAIEEITTAVRETFEVDGSSEITVECNPESVRKEFLDECKKCGVNRISMGLQSSDYNVLYSIGRLHTKEGFIAAAELAASRFNNISSDLILGLPEQSTDDVKASIKLMSEFCDHASVYALTVEEGTPLYSSGYRPDDDRIAELYETACAELYSLGFERYEVSNFAKNNRQSRHNIKYWMCAPYIGFGVAAHGYDGATLRYGHTEDIARYISSPEREYTALSADDLYNEYIMLALRTERGIVLNDFYERFGYDFLKKNDLAVKRLTEDRLCSVSDGRFFIVPKYMFVMNGIITDLMV